MQMMNVGNNVGKDVGNVSEVLSVVPRTIERDLSELQKEGVIIREGSKTAGHWVLLKQIKD